MLVTDLSALGVRMGPLSVTTTTYLRRSNVHMACAGPTGIRRVWPLIVADVTTGGQVPLPGQLNATRLGASITARRVGTDVGAVATAYVRELTKTTAVRACVGGGTVLALVGVA